MNSGWMYDRKPERGLRRAFPGPTQRETAAMEPLSTQNLEVALRVLCACIFSEPLVTAEVEYLRTLMDQSEDMAAEELAAKIVRHLLRGTGPSTVVPNRL